MIESRLIRDLRARQETEDAIDHFVDTLLLVIEEVPEVRAAIADIITTPTPPPVAVPPPTRKPTRGAVERKRLGGRRG